MDVAPRLGNDDRTETLLRGVLRGEGEGGMRDERSVGLGMFVAISGASLMFLVGALPLHLAMLSVVVSGVVIAIAEATR